MGIFNDDSVPFENLDLNFRDQTIFLDIDGTLLPDNLHDFDSDSPALRHLELLKRANRVFICTNSNARIRNKSAIERLLGAPVVTSDHKKPSAKILKALGVRTQSGNLLVIGDKFLTDGLFAINIGARFVKIKRKISGGESPLMRSINLLDNAVWHMIRLLNII